VGLPDSAEIMILTFFV